VGLKTNPKTNKFQPFWNNGQIQIATTSYSKKVKHSSKINIERVYQSVKLVDICKS
jgi:hypothetical protein